METKWCHGCETEKSVKEFSKHRRAKDGLQSKCKICNATYQNSHKAERATYQHEYYQVNREEITIKQYKYRQNHKAECHARTKASMLRHPIRVKARKAVRNAIRSGELVCPDHCENPECNKLCKPEAHHHNGYEPEHWLDVVFLCAECHIKADQKMKEERKVI